MLAFWELPRHRCWRGCSHISPGAQAITVGAEHTWPPARGRLAGPGGRAQEPSHCLLASAGLAVSGPGPHVD